ncbi:MAG: SHD1 domain-containing protein, partial [Verrucomicrobiota bacterium]
MQSRRVGATIGSTLLGLTAMVYPDVRTWTDQSSGRTIEAEFVNVAAGKVQLTRSDGKTFAVPLSRFTKADQHYVAGQLKNRAPTPSAMDIEYSARLDLDRSDADIPPRKIDLTVNIKQPNNGTILKYGHVKVDHAFAGG